MLPLYLLALGFGGTMILVSLILGAGDKEFGAHDVDHSADHAHDVGHDLDPDADHDLDPDADHDADHQVDKGSLDKSFDKSAEHGGSSGFSMWWLLSMRFWTFGLATFGLTGTLLSMLSVPSQLTSILSILVGLSLGVGAARLFRALNRDEVSGTTELSRYVGEEARVVVPVRAGQPGKIAIQTMAGRVEMLATTRDQEPLGMGTTVIIASVENGIADVSRLPVLPGTGHAHRQRAAAHAARNTERSGG